MSSSDEHVNIDIPEESEPSIKEDIKNEVASLELPEINEIKLEEIKPEPKKRAGRKPTLSTLKKDVLPKKEKIEKKLPLKEDILEKKNKTLENTVKTLQLKTKELENKFSMFQQLNHKAHIISPASSSSEKMPVQKTSTNAKYKSLLTQIF